MEQLNKNQFDQMPLNDQIKYINNELRKEGSSLTGICKEIGIARSTVRERSKNKVSYLIKIKSICKKCK